MAASSLILNPSSLDSSASSQRFHPQRSKKIPSFSAVKHYSSLDVANHSLRFESLGAVAELLCQARAGLEEGHAPRLASEGSGGVYFLSDEWGLENAAVFKPTDEEPLARNNPRGFVAVSASVEGLKRGTRVGEGAVREVAAYLLDQAGSYGCGFAGVPPTVMVRCYSEAFSYGRQNPTFRRPKIGSLQRFVRSISSCEDMGPSNFPVQEVHKITVLDLRLANTDRNGGNILVCQNKGEDGRSSIKLVPIDHGYCLPAKLEDCTFEWLNWPQAQQPYSPSTLSYIASLDAHRDVKLLRDCGWNLRASTARVLHASTMLLKKGAAAGLSPFEIGCMMSRYQSADTPSPLEEMMEEAVTRSHDQDGFLRLLSHLVDLHIAKLGHL